MVRLGYHFVVGATFGKVDVPLFVAGPPFVAGAPFGDVGVRLLR